MILTDFKFVFFERARRRYSKWLLLLLLDTTGVYGEERAPEITVTESEKFDKLENTSCVGHCSLCQTIWTRGLPARDSSSITGLALDKSFP